MKSKGVAPALFAAIVLFTLDPLILQLSLPPRRPSAEALARRADPNPELAVFLAGVHARTEHGDSVVLLLPAVLNRQKEAYLYRASYHLAGRDVLLPEDLREAKYVAAWRVRVSGDVVWADHGGALVRLR